jgi:hypothetical protein
LAAISRSSAFSPFCSCRRRALSRGRRRLRLSRPWRRRRIDLDVCGGAWRLLPCQLGAPPLARAEVKEEAVKSRCGGDRRLKSRPLVGFVEGSDGCPQPSSRRNQTPSMTSFPRRSLTRFRRVSRFGVPAHSTDIMASAEKPPPACDAPAWPRTAALEREEYVKRSELDNLPRPDHSAAARARRAFPENGCPSRRIDPGMPFSLSNPSRNILVKNVRAF